MFASQLVFYILCYDYPPQKASRDGFNQYRLILSVLDDYLKSENALASYMSLFRLV
jgi:hypothetical protein